MSGRRGGWQHVYDVLEIIVLFVVYVVALSFGTVSAAILRGGKWLQAAVGRTVRRVARPSSFFGRW